MFFLSSAVQTGSLLLDSSTIDPAVSREMDKLATGKGATYMDAPVSGGDLRSISVINETANIDLCILHALVEVRVDLYAHS